MKSLVLYALFFFGALSSAAAAGRIVESEKDIPCVTARSQLTNAEELNTRGSEGVLCAEVSGDERGFRIERRALGAFNDYVRELAGSSRCDYSSQCPGSSLCKNGRCVKSNGDGTECDYSSQCPGSSLCKSGRCVKSNGDGTECDYSSQCPGSEVCRSGRCQRP